MKTEIIQKNYTAKEKLLDLLDKKLSKFDKYLGKNASAKVVLSKTGNLERYKLEVTIKDNSLFVRSEVQSDNMYANLDTCLAKLERQIARVAGKSKDSVKAFDPSSLLFFDELPEIAPARIVKEKEFELDALTEDQAIDQLELLDNDFFIYKDAVTGNANVIYKRQDGNYGLIKTH